MQNVDNDELQVRGSPSGCESEVDGNNNETTVFVNGANFPAGRLALRGGVRSKSFGGPGFQPVVVDLKE